MGFDYAIEYFNRSTIQNFESREDLFWEKKE